VTRLSHRRWIVVWVLFSQLFGTLGYASSVHPMSVHADAAPAAHCSGHAQASTRIQHGIPHSCDCGLCKCPCALAASLPAGVAPLNASLRSLPLIVLYRSPDVTKRTSTFFRPPI
jgi:hypothetical protein